MKTLKLLVKNITNVFLPTSTLDEIVHEGFVPIETGEEARHLPEDWELYGRDNERVIYNGRTDEIVDRYDLTNVRR